MTSSTATAWYRNPVSWQLGFFLVLLAAASFSVAISQISLGLALVVMMWRWVRRGELPPRTGVEVPAAWLALWALAMIPFSADVGQSMVFYRRFFLFAALWTGCSLSTSERNRNWLLIGLLSGAMGISLYGQIVVAREVGGLFTRRFMGTSNSMTSGALLMMVVLVVVGFIAVGGVRRRWRWALAAAVLPVGVALIQTMTRSALLGLGCGLGAMVLLVRPRRFLIFLGAGLLLVVVTIGFGEKVLSPRMWSRVNPEYFVNGYNTSARLEMWRGGLEIIKAHPLTGVGDCDLAEISRQYYGDEDTRYFGHLHSNQIMLAAIWGIPGFILGHLFIIVPLILLIRRWRALVKVPDVRRVNSALAGWILGAIGVWVSFFVAGFTEWYFGDAEPMVLYLAIIGIALGTRAE